MRSFKKMFVGMTAAAIAASCMTISAFAATNLNDVFHPDESDETMNDAYYAIGAMGYFMNNDGKWKWNNGDWCTWNADNNDGTITIEYKINKALTDTTMSDKGSLGEMGVMVCNLDEGLEKIGKTEADLYPLAVTVKDARFVAEDGTETTFTNLLEITEMAHDPEGGIRFHIRPTDRVDEDTGEVIFPATAETEGWDAEGGFQGGTLYVTLDFGAPAAAGEETSSAAADDSSKKADDSSKKADDSSAKADDSSKKETSTTTTTTTTTTGAGGGGSLASDNTAKAEQPETGAAEGLIFAGVALAAAGIVITKRK